MNGELHNAMGDIYLSYMDIPESVVSRSAFMPLEIAYRNYEANPTVSNAAAFVDEAGKVQRIANGNGYNVDSPYVKVNAAMEADAAKRLGTQPDIGIDATDIGEAATDIGASAIDIGKNATDIGVNAKAYVDSGDGSARKVKTYGALRDDINKMTEKEYIALEKQGEKMYDAFREMEDDFVKISHNTGIDLQDMKDIKEHIFVKEHRFDDGTLKRFDPLYWQAEAWDRLIKGIPIESDITLLKHELFELKYMRENDVTYEVAHDKANELYNWAEEVFGR